MKCFCGGRGWVVPRGEEWWVFCHYCNGEGRLSMKRAAKLLGVGVTTLKKLDRGEKISKRKLVTVIDRITDMIRMLDRRAA